MCRNRMAKWLASPVFMVCLVGSLLVACAAPATTPTPATTVAPTPTTTPTQVIKWKFANMWAPAGQSFDMVSWWINQVETKSNGRIKVEAFWSNSLVGSLEQLDGTGRGITDVGVVTPTSFATRLPLATLFGLPGNGYSRIDWATYVTVRAIREVPAFAKETADANIIVITPAIFPAMDALMGKKAIRTVADLKGLRVMVYAQRGEVFAKLGAVPTRVDLVELYTSMQSGLLDEVLYYTNTFHNYKVHEVSKYLTQGLPIAQAMSYFAVNKDRWDALPADLKQIFTAIQDGAPAAWQAIALDPDDIKAREDDFRKAGVEFIQLPAAEFAKIESIMTELQPSWFKTIGGKTAQDAQDFLNAARKDVVAKYPNGLPAVPHYRPPK